MRLRTAAAAALALAIAVPVLAQDKPAEPPATPPPAPALSPSQAKAHETLKKAYAWLVKQQNENGSFGKIPGTDPKSGEAGISALALRAMSKAPADLRKELEPAMEKTASYLVSLQVADGSIANPGAGLTTYRTSIGIMALQSLDAAKYADAIQKGRGFLEKTQWSEDTLPGASAAEKKASPFYGGWGYDKDGARPDADLSNAHFAIEALRECGLPPDSPVFKRAAVFIQRCQNRSESNDLKAVGIKIGDDGGFMYDPALDTTKSAPVQNPDGTVTIPSYASITYAGLMSLLHANVAKDDPRVKGAIAWIEKNYTLDENRGLGTRANPQGAKQGLYYYYQTFAKALAAWGEREVKAADGTAHRWADELVNRLAEQQKPEGFWVNDVKRWWEDDPVLCTTYAAIAIETAWPWLDGGEKAAKQ